MVEIESNTSRRALLGGFTAASIVAFPGVTSLEAAIAGLPYAPTDTPVLLRRSREGRGLSRFRYHNAEAFFVRVEREVPRCRSDQLYQVGIVHQLGLSSHLLDVGFDDGWCARHIGLDVAKSLAYANATGLGHDSVDLARLAAILSPYGKWRNGDVGEVVDACPFPDAEVQQLTRALLERVRHVTGHPRPRGWSRR